MTSPHFYLFIYLFIYLYVIGSFHRGVAIPEPGSNDKKLVVGNVHAYTHFTYVSTRYHSHTQSHSHTRVVR